MGWAIETREGLIVLDALNEHADEYMFPSLRQLGLDLLDIRYCGGHTRPQRPFSGPRRSARAIVMSNAD